MRCGQLPDPTGSTPLCESDLRILICSHVNVGLTVPWMYGDAWPWVTSMALRSLKLLGGGAVRGSDGHPADDDERAHFSEEKKGNCSQKGHFFPRLPGRGGGSCPLPRLGRALTSCDHTNNAHPSIVGRSYHGEFRSPCSPLVHSLFTPTRRLYSAIQSNPRF